MMNQSQAVLVSLLNKAISVEYGALFVLPQHIAVVQDEEIKRQLRQIAEMEMIHAERTAQLIFSLGGEPTVDFPMLKPLMTLKEIIDSCVVGEQKSIEIYSQIIDHDQLGDKKPIIERMRNDEEGHLRLLRKIQERL